MAIQGHINHLSNQHKKIENIIESEMANPDWDIILMGAFLWLTVFGFQNAQTLIFVSAFLAFPCLKAFLFLMRSWKIRRMQIATKYGERQLAQTRKRLSEKRPITALTEVLKEEDYNPIFSELMALYGIEALVLLA